ncbi:MAG: XTP/dITP diphosphatase [Candidatus Omnitrophica bacterium]|nr:XTP/dITP diphosphatase [Candidatus Omnitrophota bacterium]
MKILIASQNRKKLRELQILLQDLGVEVISPKDLPREIPEPEENGNTFRENAIKKAVSYAEQSGLLTIADDSGLCVDALKGAPGVRSARFAGEEKDDAKNCRKLLDLMKDISHEKRTARFVCAVAIAKPGSLIDVVEGECRGFIADSARGTNGFGYDPVFIYSQFGKTFAEVSQDLKNSVSHRSKALELAKEKLKKYWTVN